MSGSGTTWKRETKLLLSSDSEDDDGDGRDKGKGLPQAKGMAPTLTVNKNYAERYNNWRGMEEIQKYKDRFGNNAKFEEDDESDSSSSDTDVELVDDKQFLKTLACLKKKDPKIYDEKLSFFPDAPVDSDKSTKKETKKAKEEKKPFRLKDHEREMILKAAAAEGDNSDLDEDPDSKVRPPIHNPPSYFEELRDIKSEITSAAHKIDSESDGEDGSDLLLKTRQKSITQVENEEEDYKKWLKGQVDKLEGGNSSKADEKELRYLRDYWLDPKLDDGEQFLRDYILNRKYVAAADEKDEKVPIPTYDEIVHDSDEDGLSGDEARLEQMEEFEQKYNFRFEEPDAEFIKKYPRTVQNSIRRKETKRKEERERIREVKKAEKERRVAEIQQLKAFTRKQILDKIRQLQESSGAGNFTEEDVDGDFDPDAYDSRAKELFNEEFYSNCPDEKKPVFSDLEDFDMEDEGEDESEPEAAAEPEEPVPGPSRGKKRKHEKISEKKSKTVLEALEESKSKLDPLVAKRLEEEYYKLEFEDIVGGDIPCRFKYREVVPNDFGLTTEEILAAPDRELNRWSSIKKTYLYRSNEEEMYDVHAYGLKKGDIRKKKQLLATLYEDPPEEDEDGEGEGDDEEETTPESGESKKKKRKKSKSKKAKINSENGNAETTAEAELAVPIPIATESNAAEPAKKSRKRKKKNKKRGEGGAPAAKAATAQAQNSDKNGTGKKKGKNTPGKSTPKTNGPPVLNPDRLAAYGINPKKYDKWVKYGGAEKNPK